MPLHYARLANKPETFFSLVWPDCEYWRKQRDTLVSFHENFGTIVHSAIEMGKDWLAARALIWFYATRFPCKVIATSTSHIQLKGALWGEIGAALREAKIDLGIHMKETWELIRKDAAGKQYKDDWFRLASVKDVESLSGIHLAPGPNGEPTVAAAIDEASGVKDDFFKSLEGQAHRMLSFGNPLRMSGYFVERIKAGDQRDELYPDRFRWKIIHIDAAESPNIQAGKTWDDGGRVGECPVTLPGVMSYGDYLNYLRDWDSYHIATRLHGQLAPPGGSLFDRSTFRYCREAFVRDVDGNERAAFVLTKPDGTERTVFQDECWWFQTIDTALTENTTSDYTAILTGAVTPPPERCLVVIHIFRDRIQVPKQFGILMAQRERWPLLKGNQAVENKASGIGLIQEARLNGTPFRILDPKTKSKVERTTAVLTAYENGLVYHKTGEPWLGDYENELLEFPAGTHDDQVDVTSYAGLMFQQQCFRAAQEDDDLVCYPTRDEDVRQAEKAQDVSHLSVAEQLTGRPLGATPPRRGFGL